MKKYEFTSETLLKIGITFKRIKRISDGELGGFLEKEENLSHYGNAWVSGNAWVFGNAKVSGNAEVCGHALVSGNAEVSGDAKVFGDAGVSGKAEVSGNARVFGNAWVSGNAEVFCGKIKSSQDFVTFFWRSILFNINNI